MMRKQRAFLDDEDMKGKQMKTEHFVLTQCNEQNNLIYLKYGKNHMKLIIRTLILLLKNDTGNAN